MSIPEALIRGMADALRFKVVNLLLTVVWLPHGFAFLGGCVSVLNPAAHMLGPGMEGSLAAHAGG